MWTGVNISLQGGAINHGLFVEGLLSLPLGSCQSQDDQNPIGNSPGDGVNGAVGVGSPSVAMEIACR